MLNITTSSQRRSMSPSYSEEVPFQHAVETIARLGNWCGVSPSIALETTLGRHHSNIVEGIRSALREVPGAYRQETLRNADRRSWVLHRSSSFPRPLHTK